VLKRWPLLVLEPSARTIAAWQRRTNVWHKATSPCEGATLQKAKSIARHLGLTLRQLRSGSYRVNFRDGNETTAYYTDKLEDAVNAVVAMARKRAFSSDCQADRARPQANAPLATAPGLNGGENAPSTLVAGWVRAAG